MRHPGRRCPAGSSWHSALGVPSKERKRDTWSLDLGSPQVRGQRRNAWWVEEALVLIPAVPPSPWVTLASYAVFGSCFSRVNEL